MKKFLYELFSDNNNLNEKSIVGFLAFGMMVTSFLVDILTGWLGREFVINEFIYDGFLVITLGSFGIASIDKFINNKSKKNDGTGTGA
jgi:ABC-type uncharacterized transport system permease subunit